METDISLVARARRGDSAAFSQLVQRHHASVHRAARAMVNSADAEDIVQDAWLHAYVHLGKFRGTASFKTWVHAIVRNRAIDHHRTARRRPSHQIRASDAPAHAELPCDARSPEQLVLDAERRDQLSEAMALLPGQLRNLLTLWHTGHYSYQEMAEISGVALSTIKSRVFVARQRVMQTLSVPR